MREIVRFVHQTGSGSDVVVILRAYPSWIRSFCELDKMCEEELKQELTTEVGVGYLYNLLVDSKMTRNESHVPTDPTSQD